MATKQDIFLLIKELAGLVGTSSSYTTDLDFLNAICVQIGGVGGHLTEQFAWDEIGTIGFFTSQYKTAYNAMVIKPDAPRAAAQNQIVKSWVNAGIWEELDFLYFLQQTSSAAGLINLINPSGFSAELVDSPTFIANKGFYGDGISSHIKTNYNPVVNGEKYTLNDCSFGCVTLENNENTIQMGLQNGITYDGTTLTVSSTVFSIRINGVSRGYVNTLPIAAGYHINRTSDVLNAIYKNGVQCGLPNKTSIAVENLEMYLLAINRGNTVNSPSQGNIAVAYAGGALTVEQIKLISDEIAIYNSIAF